MRRPAGVIATSSATGARDDPWPDLSGGEWRDTATTLNLWSQLLGKTRLALSPWQNHWWHTALYLTPRGLDTSLIPHRDGSFAIELDLTDHQLVARTSAGAVRTLPLGPGAMADFHHSYRELLRSLGIEARIRPVPSEMAEAVPFEIDRLERAYDPASAHRLWRALIQADRVLKQFRGRFLGKSSPVHLWWGGFDLACTRFSGRPAPRHPGGIPNLPDRVTREAYSHECISAGWWAGSPGGAVAEPAFYAYAYPEPVGCAEAAIAPAEASYRMELREWILPYQALRRTPDRDATLTEFLQSTYEAAADRGGWQRSSLERPSNAA